MARQRKAQARTGKKKRKPVPGWIWLLGGLVPGVGVALYFYFDSHKTPTQLPGTPVAAHSVPADNNTSRTGKPEKATSPPAKPRFDFYTLLPEMEVVIPESEISTVLRQPQSAVATEKASYILQVGSFKDFADADKLKARLALMGVQAKIETVRIGSRASWHRVRIGPSSDIEQLRKIRNQLQRNAINTVLLKTRG